MTQINIKKVRKYAFILYAAIIVLFTAGAFQRLVFTGLFGVPKIIFALALYLIGALVLFLWLRRMERCVREEKKCFGLAFIQTLFRYRFLIEQLVSRDFKIKYKRSVLGVFWSFLNPLLMMIVQYVVFSHLLGIRGNVDHYAIYLLCGIVMWNGFNDCSTQATRSITSNAHLITKVYVPKYIYPLTRVLSSAINMLLSMIPLLLVTLVYGLFSNPHLYLTNAVFLIPFGLLFVLVFSIGMGFLLSGLMVFFHDVEFLWSVLSTIWMYGTPIIYSLSMFEGKAPWLITVMKFNPLYHFIDFMRTIIVSGTSPAFLEFVICAAFSGLMLLIGYSVFHKLEDKFILYL
ncbi:MAG: ABC transporter permease [Lachnospiraceae bacterium]|nr:ABC transporter permease [Lachnospiraceae bacterium]